MEKSIRHTLADDGTVTVSVRGEIDYANSTYLAKYLCDLAADGSTLVRVDLREASFIDSTGLGALIEGYRAIETAGGRFVVVSPSPAFRRVLTVTGLCELFGLTDPAADEARPAQATGA